MEGRDSGAFAGGDPESSVYTRQPGLQPPVHVANAVCDLGHFAFLLPWFPHLLG